jgi:tetratricopeptide (TPR) repeat protein
MNCGCQVVGTHRSGLTRTAILFCLTGWLAIVPLALNSSSIRGADQSACTGNSRWIALIQQGGNPRLPAGAREKAYQEARTLCPQSPAAYDGLAVLLLRRQDPGAALDWINQGLALAPRNPALTLDLGVALLAAGEPAAALQALKSRPPSARTEFYLGMAYRALREHEAARRAFAKSFAMGDHDPYVLYQLIEQDRALHDEKEGLQDFRTFYERFPRSPWLHLLLGNAYIAQHNADGAAAEYRQAAQLDPKLPLVHFNLGRLAFDQADYRQALHDFEDEIAVDPIFGEAYLYGGTALRRLGNNQLALPYLKEAVARDPNNPLAYRELAVAEIQAQQLQQASSTLREGERRFPQEAAFPAQLARLLGELGDVQGARGQSRLAETLSARSNPRLGAVASGAASSRSASSASTPEMQQLQNCLRQSDAQCAEEALARTDGAKLARDAGYLNLKAETLYLQHRYKPALSAIQRAIALDPHRAESLITQGRIDQRLGNERAAITSFLEAERIEPGAEAPVYYLGMSFFMLGYDKNDNGDYDRAARHFKIALQLDSQDDRAAFMVGVIDSIEFKLAGAKKYLAEALKMNPRNPYYHLHYGLLLSRTGHFEEAESEMKRAETLDPSYAITYLRLGDVDVEMREYAAARTQLETAVRLDPHLSSSYYTLGRVYYRLGLRAKSREALEKFQTMKSQAENETDPMGAAVNAVVSRTAPE